MGKVLTSIKVKESEIENSLCLESRLLPSVLMELAKIASCNLLLVNYSIHLTTFSLPIVYRLTNLRR